MRRCAQAATRREQRQHQPVSHMTATATQPAAFDEAGIDRFGFGRNWLNYQTSIDPARLQAAGADIEMWLGTQSLRGLRVLDIGSGSGVHSYCMHAMGAASLVSFDYDADSVEATRALHADAGAPSSWTVMQGSVLDAEFMASLGTFDLVYSWGVLHHTGSMWQAITNAAARVKEDGTFFISIYAKGPRFDSDLALKQRYHNASLSGKRRMEFEWIADRYRERTAQRLVPDAWWTQGLERGMDPYFDLVDWLGGLPYEVATVDELITHLYTQGVATRRHRACLYDGGCHILVAQRRSLRALPDSSPDDVPSAAVRLEWPAQAPVVWVGAIDGVHAPQHAVAVALRMPDLPFVMVAAGFSTLDPATRHQLGNLAPNLRIIDHPHDVVALKPLLQVAGAILHTADNGPSDEWLALAAAAGIPICSLHDDASGATNRSGFGVTCDGNLERLANELAAMRLEYARYARACLAALNWSESAELRQAATASRVR